MHIMMKMAMGGDDLDDDAGYDEIITNARVTPSLRIQRTMCRKCTGRLQCIPQRSWVIMVANIRTIVT